jgi:hypothetical protein
MAEQKEFTAVSAIRQFFGLKPGETLQEFMQELKALTPEDKKELAEAAVKELGGKLKE